MAILDDDDPIVILQNKIHQAIDKQDGHTAIAALSMTLTAALRLAASKQPHRPAPILLDLCADLEDLSISMIRAVHGPARES